jgi:hypothetical protein
MFKNPIIAAMDAHAKDFGLEVTTIGQLAVQSRHAYERIKRGTAHRETERRVAAWIKQDRLARVAEKPHHGAALLGNSVQSPIPGDAAEGSCLSATTAAPDSGLQVGDPIPVRKDSA